MTTNESHEKLGTHLKESHVDRSPRLTSSARDMASAAMSSSALIARVSSSKDARCLSSSRGASGGMPASYRAARHRRSPVETSAIFGGLFGGGAAKRDAAKTALLDAIEGTNRGVSASDEDVDAVEAAASALERLNPTRAGALRSPLVNGEWELLYTTSASILGANKPPFARPIGPIYQTIDVARGRARNRETFPFYNAVDADLTPTSKSAVNVQFVKFFILGFLPITAPESAKGALDITYLDDELRVSRGDKGNLFVLRMHDPSVELPRPEDD